MTPEKAREYLDRYIKYHPFPVYDANLQIIDEQINPNEMVVITFRQLLKIAYNLTDKI